MNGITQLTPSSTFTEETMAIQHILSADQFEWPYLERIFKRADEMRELYYNGEGGRSTLRRKFQRYDVVMFFYESSSRTLLSHNMAASRLGMTPHVIINAREFSSASKGETSTDTMRVLNEYDPDLVVIRHDVTGAVAEMAEVARVPIINAGDGKGEHPTQFLLDTYTIWKHKKKLDGLKIIIGGDLQRGRTARSLASGLSKFPENKFVFISRETLRMRDDVKQTLRKNGAVIQERFDLNVNDFKGADVIYWTRDQNERPKDADDSGEVTPLLDTASLVITPEVMSWAPEDCILMHPLPIDRDKSKTDGEITEDLYDDPRCVIFKQSGNGLWVRMAAIEDLMLKYSAK
jgi:aspartate carbamoyltransferase catalytic subunit